MSRRNDGFTLVELMIAMVAFVMVLLGASQIFTGLLTQFKQQSKAAETNIEGAIGLDVLRRDIEHSGMGVPLLGLIAYTEPGVNYYVLNNAPAGAPMGIISMNNVAAAGGPTNIIVGSDYLVMRATSLVTYNSNVSEKWTLLMNGNVKRTWALASEDLATTDYAVVINPSSRTLITSGGSFYTSFGGTAAFAPPDAFVTYVVYGIAPAGITPKMPFNRADYYVRRPSIAAGDIFDNPQRCAPNTGVLFKATVRQSDLGYDELPIVDCVADMQVVYMLDRDGDGTAESASPTLTDLVGAPLTADQVGRQLKEVRVYVLAHEGQIDRNYTFNNFTCGANCVLVGEPVYAAAGRNFNLTTIPNFQNYRWKVYTLAVKPLNLR